MADRLTITCGVCGLIGPALAPDLPPSTGCLHDATVPEGDRICYPARVMVLEHALRRAVAPDCFDADRKILPGKLGQVLMAANAAWHQSAQDLRSGKGETAPDLITAAAQMMLDNHNALGSPGYNGALGLRVLSAAIFAAEALRATDDYDAAAVALLRAFLTALIDPLHPDLDYLRADPAAGAKAREGRDA